jgi:hypothetical protein
MVPHSHRHPSASPAEVAHYSIIGTGTFNPESTVCEVYSIILAPYRFFRILIKAAHYGRAVVISLAPVPENYLFLIIQVSASTDYRL